MNTVTISIIFHETVATTGEGLRRFLDCEISNFKMNHSWANQKVGPLIVSNKINDSQISGRQILFAFHRETPIGGKAYAK